MKNLKSLKYNNSIDNINNYINLNDKVLTTDNNNKNEIKVNRSLYHRYDKKDRNKKLKEEIEEPKVDKSATNLMSSYTRKFYKNKFSNNNINNYNDEEEENLSNNRKNYSNISYNYNNKYSKYEKEKEKEISKFYYYGKYSRKRTNENSIHNTNENLEEDDDKSLN